MLLKSRLKYAREYLGKTQTEMAEAVGKTKSGWQTYEKGSAIPGGNVFEELAKLGFNISWFFSDDVPMLLADIQDQPKNQAPAQPRANTQSTVTTPTENLSIGESVDLLAKVYTSGNTVLIRSVTANLNACVEAVDNKDMAKKTINMMEEMNKRILAMEKSNAELQKEILNLKNRPRANNQFESTG